MEVSPCGPRWGQTHRRAGRIVVRELHVRKLQVTVELAFIDDNSQHLCHYVVHKLNASLLLGW